MQFRLLPPSENRKPKSWLAVVLFLGLLGGILLRIFWLRYPDVRVFDEVYFPVFAKNYLEQTVFFDVHPPLGKLLISAGIWLFGDSGFGWRIVPLLFGLASIWLVGACWHAWTKDRLASVLVAFFLGIDGMFIAYSRTGLMDGILFFFMFLTLYFMIRNRERVPLLGVATLLGLAMSVKWVGIAVLAPVAFLAYKRGKFNELLFSVWWAAGIYFLIVMLGQWLTGSTDVLSSSVEWHLQSARYQATLTATHPYASEWWSWPLMTRPVLFIYDSFTDGAVQVMTTLGNPLVWWSSTVAVVASFGYLLRQKLLRKEKISEHPLFLPLLGWAAAYLPFAFVNRVMFLYHYMPAYGFALMVLAYWLARGYRRDPWVVVGLCAAFLLVSIYFVPFFVGWWPLSAEALQDHVWIKHWIY